MLRAFKNAKHFMLRAFKNAKRSCWAFLNTQSVHVALLSFCRFSGSLIAQSLTNKPVVHS
jgi:hypothetical protein